MPWSLDVPAFSGDAGIGELVAIMREPAYLRLVGKAMGTAFGVNMIARRLPPAAQGPLALMAGIYIGLEMAAWLEEDAVKRKRGPVIEATAEPIAVLVADAEVVPDIDIAHEEVDI